MNWDAISAVAELFGAIAVVISLLYLARQLRQSARIEGAASFRSIMDGVREVTNHMHAPQNLETLTRGYRSRRSLPPDEMMRFDHLIGSLLNQVEATHMTLEAQMYTEDAMANWVWFLRTRIFCFPGAREWWDEYKPGYEPASQAFIQRIVDSVNTKDQDPFGLLIEANELPSSSGRTS